MSHDADVQVLKERMADVREDIEALGAKVDGLCREVHALTDVWREQSMQINVRLKALEDLAETGRTIGKAALQRGLPILAAILGAVALGGDTVAKAIVAAFAP